MATRARAFVTEHFDRAQQAKPLIAALESLTSAHASSRGGGWYRRWWKRPFDLLVASVSLILLSPIMLVIWLAARWQFGSPALFRQPRGGLCGRPFHVLKFRTMTNDRGADGQLLPDHQRLTGFGRLLRALSLDELPQLWNVLCGDMSLVGPRPLHERYLRRYTANQARRHEVRPGMTGWAQVNGRNAISWEEKFRHDVWYVDHCNLLTDIKICLLTVARVVLRDGINSDRHTTMPEFTGTPTTKEKAPN